MRPARARATILLLPLAGLAAIASCGDPERPPPAPGELDAAPADVTFDVSRPETDVASSDALADAEVEDGGCGTLVERLELGGACSAVAAEWKAEGFLHLEAGTPIEYCARPPHSGHHYETWLAYRVYDKPIPYVELVHSLEHGAVAILHRCVVGTCPEVKAQIAEVIEARPVDPKCTDPVRRRIIVAPDPTLDAPLVAVAWTWTYRAKCVDKATLGKFIADRYAKTTEDDCRDGVVPP